MISKKMYAVLSCFPRTVSKPINFETLLEKCELTYDEIMECLGETTYPAANYIRTSHGHQKGSELYFTERGLAEVDAYEDSMAEHRIVKQSLFVAIIAMIAAVASAIAAIASLIIMLV